MNFERLVLYDYELDDRKFVHFLHVLLEINRLRYVLAIIFTKK